MNSFAVLSLAFGLGLLHALDADHIMAVSALSTRKPGVRASLQFCLRWAIGHGFTLLLIGGSVLLLGMAIPHSLSTVAETLVGIMLIGIGLWVIWELVSRRAHLHFHHHDDIPRHAHWHAHKKRISHPLQPETRHKTTTHKHEHSATIVGVLHGAAGSAPLLAIIPLTSMGGSPWLGIAYLLLFCCGVLISMLIFGGLLGSTYQWLSHEDDKRGNHTVRLLRTTVAISSIGFGSFLLQASLAGNAA